MEVKIEKKDGFSVLGILERAKDGPSFIPALWERLGKLENEIQHLYKSTSVGYGVMDHHDPSTKEFDYLAGHEARPAEDTPEGLTRWDVPGRPYAVVPCTMETIMDAYRHFTVWCASEGYKRSDSPEFEFYPPSFGDIGKMYMYFPIEKA
jgi:predicted transcriptional regulator YdeE